MAGGITPLDLAGQDAVSDDRGRGSVAYRIPVTLSAAGTVRLHYGPSERKFRVLGLSGYMLAAGGTSVVLQDSDGNEITDAINVAALPDKTSFEHATIDNDYNVIDPASGEGLRIVVVGAVSAQVWVDCEPL